MPGRWQNQRIRGAALARAQKSKRCQLLENLDFPAMQIALWVLSVPIRFVPQESHSQAGSTTVSVHAMNSWTGDESRSICYFCFQEMFETLTWLSQCLYLCYQNLGEWLTMTQSSVEILISAAWGSLPNVFALDDIFMIEANRLFQKTLYFYMLIIKSWANREMIASEWNLNKLSMLSLSPTVQTGK